MPARVGALGRHLYKKGRRMEDWKKNPAFIGGTNFEERVINGKTMKFHPISSGLMFRLRRLAVPIAKALTTLFQKTGTDLTVIERSHSGDEGDGREVIQEALSPSLAKLRTQQRADAMAELIEALSAEQNQLLLGQIITDSLREEFPRSMPTKDVQEFISSLEVPTLVALLKGVAAANSEVLGPLEGQVRSHLAAGREEVMQEMEEPAPATAG